MMVIRVMFMATLLSIAGAAAADETSSGTAELQKCKICHSLEKGAPNRVGPNLFGVYGRKAGMAPGYNYSEALKRSGIVWNDASLSAFLRDPQGEIPGSHMSFPGIKDDDERAGLLQELKQATQ